MREKENGRRRKSAVNHVILGAPLKNITVIVIRRWNARGTKKIAEKENGIEKGAGKENGIEKRAEKVHGIERRAEKENENGKERGS